MELHFSGTTGYVTGAYWENSSAQQRTLELTPVLFLNKNYCGERF
jgi:hypothetical protein